MMCTALAVHRKYDMSSVRIHYSITIFAVSTLCVHADLCYDSHSLHDHNPKPAQVLLLYPYKEDAVVQKSLQTAITINYSFHSTQRPHLVS